MHKILLIAGSFLALALVAWWALYVFGAIEGVELSGHGIAAMTAGFVLTCLVGFGLMTLIFFSNKHGHDDEVHNLYKEVMPHEADQDNKD